MDGGDGDGNLRFDFEDDLDVAYAGFGFARASSTAATAGGGYFSPCASSDAPISAAVGLSHARGRRNIEIDGDDGDLRFDFEDDLDVAGAGFGSACASSDAAGAAYFSPSVSSDARIPAAGGSSHARGRGNIKIDDDDGDLRFDFEDHLDAVGAGSGSSEAHIPAEEGRLLGRGNFRQTVCQLDEEGMPMHHFFRASGHCSTPDCIFKHIVEECEMYKIGFCPNGPDCRYMHVKQSGPPPPVQEVLNNNAYNYGSSSRTHQPRDNNRKQKEKPQVQQGSVLKNQNLAVNATLVAQQPAAKHAQTAKPQSHLQQEQNAQVQGVHKGSSNQKLQKLQAHFHKGNQGTRLLEVAARRIWKLWFSGVFVPPMKGLTRLNLTKHLNPWRVSFQYSLSLELVISRPR